MDQYKRLRKNPLFVAGKADGKLFQPVVAGFFEFVNGQGLPLDVVLYYFKDNGFIPEWREFFMESLNHGWNPKSTLTKIQVACEDVYGFEHAAQVVSKLREHVGFQEENL